MSTTVITLISFGGFFIVLFILFMNNHAPDTKELPDIKDQYLKILERNGWVYQIHTFGNKEILYCIKNAVPLRFIITPPIKERWEWIMKEMTRYDKTFEIESKVEVFNKLIDEYYKEV